MSINSWIKKELGFKPDTPDEVVSAEWEKRVNSVCKPCWELKYCPYGVLVEQFPLPPVPREEALAHQEYLKNCLKTGRLGDGSPLDESRKNMFIEMIERFNEEEHPIINTEFEQDAACTQYGHLCPVFFVNEPFTETKEMRRISRQIPFKTKIRVARRDNYTCQECGKHLKDDEIEFDHIIPFSKGGSSEEHNIRLTCFKCNRSKSDDIAL
jgi:hypothetical protein